MIRYLMRNKTFVKLFRLIFLYTISLNEVVLRLVKFTNKVIYY